MTELLKAIGVRLGLLTNGEDWMLVHRGESFTYVTWNAPPSGSRSRSRCGPSQASLRPVASSASRTATPWTSFWPPSGEAGFLLPAL